jgi:hypothetical protein
MVPQFIKRSNALSNAGLPLPTCHGSGRSSIRYMIGNCVVLLTSSITA